MTQEQVLRDTLVFVDEWLERDGVIRDGPVRSRIADALRAAPAPTDDLRAALEDVRRLMYHSVARMQLDAVIRALPGVPAPHYTGPTQPPPAELVALVQEWKASLESFEDGRNDMHECDVRSLKAHDALMAWTPAAPREPVCPFCAAGMECRVAPPTREQKLSEWLANMQRHRDAWRAFANGRGPRPTDYLDSTPDHATPPETPQAETAAPTPAPTPELVAPVLAHIQMAHSILGNLDLSFSERVDAAYAVLAAALTSPVGETPAQEGQ